MECSGRKPVSGMGGPLPELARVVSRPSAGWNKLFHQEEHLVPEGRRNACGNLTDRRFDFGVWLFSSPVSSYAGPHPRHSAQLG
jgi:hypothetical protein